MLEELVGAGCGPAGTHARSPIAPVDRAPDEEVVPGVAWGRSGWVGSPAYWAMLAATEDPRDDYVRRDGCPLHHEVAFCLLGGFGIRMEVNEAAYAACLGRGILDPGRRPSAGEIEDALSMPLDVGGRPVRYRFPRQRSRRLSDALRAIEDSPPPTATARGFRAALLAIPGIGPKTASWIARNWLGADDVAILDVHVLRAGVAMNLFPAGSRLPGDYPALEDRFLAFAAAIGVRPSLLDAVIWREMRR
ncbi:8-oxoguanine DNA glycosylase [Antarcticirhabdus aurantiaca]|uniref:Uncharacterized protein n=1 Tax=Antarcticirhabdus aurantiaca TaxID=2606717 RepID=A0ACD4NRY8_9HYPH|nr:hypothetical protein [Antarcticirhabdus aurantiaca]WAJ29542.1 hypothetical protein OXU80_04720 [Jeongeuplla avenae]